MKFTNIINARTQTIRKQAEDNAAELLNYSTCADILDKWYYQQLLTPATKRKAWELTELREYLTKRIEKKAQADINKFVSRVAAVEYCATEIQSINISVDWTKSRTWGLCPMATIRVNYVNNSCDTFTSRRVTGCGFCKESTAISEALTQCNNLLHLMYAIKNENVTAKNSDLFGYGAGYGATPYFEGGTGTECYPRIFKTLGFEFNSVAHGKTFDVYTVNKY